MDGALKVANAKHGVKDHHFYKYKANFN